MTPSRSDDVTHGAGSGPVPEDVRRAIALMRGSLCRPLSMADLVRACGVPERTLNEHFRAFVGLAPMRYLRSLRLAAARKALLAAAPGSTVTGIAGEYRFEHPGRFSRQYRAAFGETPSATLRRARVAPPRPAGLWRGRPSLAIVVEAPRASDPAERRLAADVAEAVAADLARMPALDVVAAREERLLSRDVEAGYLLSVRAMQEGPRLRVVLRVVEAGSRAHVWGNSFDGLRGGAFALQDRVVEGVREAIAGAIRGAEIERATRRRPTDLDAHGLSLRALPLLFSSTPEGSQRALELLHRAMEQDPDCGLATALAAWGHGQLVMYNVTRMPAAECEESRLLARRASALAGDDPLALTALAAVRMMLHDLDAAESLVARALARDPSLGWAWGRSGWVHAYRGDAGTAIKHFRRALRLGPGAMKGNLLIGVGAAHFDAGRYGASASWMRRGMRDDPGLAWANRSLSVAYDRLGEHGEAVRALDALRRFQPDLTVGRIVSSVPFRPGFLERLASGLDTLGLPP